MMKSANQLLHDADVGYVWYKRDVWCANLHLWSWCGAISVKMHYQFDFVYWDSNHSTQLIHTIGSQRRSGEGGEKKKKTKPPKIK